MKTTTNNDDFLWVEYLLWFQGWTVGAYCEYCGRNINQFITWFDCIAFIFYAIVYSHTPQLQFECGRIYFYLYIFGPIIKETITSKILAKRGNFGHVLSLRVCSISHITWWQKWMVTYHGSSFVVQYFPNSIWMVWNLVKSKGKILPAKFTPAFGVTLDTLGKLWTAGSSAPIMTLNDCLLCDIWWTTCQW